jgi:hypothetical protein
MVAAVAMRQRLRLQADGAQDDGEILIETLETHEHVQLGVQRTAPLRAGEVPQGRLAGDQLQEAARSKPSIRRSATRCGEK